MRRIDIGFLQRKDATVVLLVACLLIFTLSAQSSGQYELSWRTIDGGNVGIGTTEPDAKLEVNGDLKVTGAYKGNIGPNNGAPFPRPAYDSGWVVTEVVPITFFHNIGGNVDNYVVEGLLRVENMSGDMWYRQMTSYYNPTPNSIEFDTGCSGFEGRVRIWVYN